MDEKSSFSKNVFPYLRSFFLMLSLVLIGIGILLIFVFGKEKENRKLFFSDKNGKEQLHCRIAGVVILTSVPLLMLGYFLFLNRTDKSVTIVKHDTTSTTAST